VRRSSVGVRQRRLPRSLSTRRKLRPMSAVLVGVEEALPASRSWSPVVTRPCRQARYGHRWSFGLAGKPRRPTSGQPAFPARNICHDVGDLSLPGAPGSFSIAVESFRQGPKAAHHADRALPARTFRVVAGALPLPARVERLRRSVRGLPARKNGLAEAKVACRQGGVTTGDHRLLAGKDE
jgi:hypothetical protein